MHIAVTYLIYCLMASWSHSQNILQHLSQAFPTKAMWSFTASYYFILLSSSLMSVMISVAFLALCPLPSFLLQNVSLMSHYLWKFENSVFPPPWHVWCFCHWNKKKKKKSFYGRFIIISFCSFVFSCFCSFFCSINSSLHSSFLFKIFFIWDFGKPCKLQPGIFSFSPHAQPYSDHNSVLTAE